MRVLVVRVTERADLFTAECGIPTRGYVNSTSSTPAKAIRALAFVLEKLEEEDPELDCMEKYGSVIDV